MRAHFGSAAEGPFVALSAGGRVSHLESGEEARADVLALYDRALAAAESSRADVTEIVVDRGPGVFSRVRHRVAVAVALAEASGLPIAAVGNISAEEAARLPVSAFARGATVETLYDRAPNITTPKSRKGAGL
jgi:tRNA A37 threonylcarbamoyladenosine modification protein TsaB